MHSQLPGGLQPAPVEQQVPTVLLPQVPAQETVTLGDLGTLPAVLSQLPRGRWWCHHCGDVGYETTMRREHRVIRGPWRWWHRVLRVAPGYTRCARQVAR